MQTTEYRIEREIVIDAPVEVVWRTITEPDQITEWFADTVDLGRGLDHLVGLRDRGEDLDRRTGAGVEVLRELLLAGDGLDLVEEQVLLRDAARLEGRQERGAAQQGERGDRPHLARTAADQPGHPGTGPGDDLDDSELVTAGAVLLVPDQVRDVMVEPAAVVPTGD